ncbi:helix-turn-helix domain-containing protein [Micromonospora zhanjiangensis]|uniref:Helix-turn-helix domain-containing protein n=1 Tax=Micromonospora zhanjiangensis TaxID=1522057 RepID=A0ABV8KVR5_9ACTN
MTGSPTLRRRRLAIALKRRREETGMTADQAAKEIGISKSAISRIENAQVSALPPVVRGLLELYGAEREEIDALAQIARDARKRGWWQKYDDVLPDWFEVYVGLETEASEVRTFQPQLIPGLLQTADYAAAVIRAEHPDAPATEIDRRVELRMRRQRDEDPPKMWVVLDEAALRRPIGGAATFKAQLQRLADVARQPGNTVQILRFDAGEHGSMGSSFSILDFPEPTDPGVVYVETRAGSLYLEGQDVREYGRVFDHLMATAKGARESRNLISEAMNDL